MKQKAVKKVQQYRFIIPTILAFLTWLFYFPSRNYAFQFDDFSNIKMFFGIRHKTLYHLFFSGTRWISYWLNTIFYTISRFEPYAYRIANILFHTITGLLVYVLACEILKRTKKTSFIYKNQTMLATITAGLFLLHPVQTQTVSYVIQGQLEGLAGLCIVLMSVLFIYATTTQSKIFALLCTSLLYGGAVLGCGTKEIFIITPALLLLIDWFFIARGSFKKVLQHWYIHIPVFLIITGIYTYFLKPEYFTRVLSLGIITHNNNGNVLTEHFHQNITSLSYFISQFKVQLHYIGIFLWPFSISADYDWITAKGLFAPDCIFPLLGLLTIAFIVGKRLYKNKIDFVSFCLLWFFVSILPRASVIPSTELVADYKTYFASIGIFLLLGTALMWIIQKVSSQKTIQWALLATVLLFCGYATYTRNKVWRSEQEFWANVITRAPKKARAYNNYATSLAKNKQHHQAIPYFRKAIELDRYYADPYNNLSVTYSAINEHDKAIDVITRSIKINPHVPEGYNNLANVLMKTKQYKRAKKALKKAIALRNHYGKAHFNLGRIYHIQKKDTKALHHFKYACCNADFDTVFGFTGYARIALQLQEYDQAIYAYKKLCQLEPESYDHILDLANTYYYKGDLEPAEALYCQLTQKNPHDSRAHLNLAELYFMHKKDYRKALTLYQKAQQSQSNSMITVRKALCHKHLGNKDMAEKLLLEGRKSSDIQTRATARQELKKL